MYDALDNGMKSMGIFLYLAKDFDTINHIELVNILLNFGIQMLSLKWFKIYLSGRKQKVTIKGIADD